MKRLVGGLFLLNLTAISLGLTAGEVSISDEEVLSQLLELRNFIDDKRDFTKGFKDLKPVLVQYRSSASKIDGVVPCNLSFNTDALHLSIAGYSVQADGTPITLRINVVYEWTNYVGYTIKTAKLEATNEFHGALAFEDIVDKDGHKRFIEGDVDFMDTFTGFTKLYGKWALCGTHLLIVFCFSIADTTEISWTGSFAECKNIPDWVLDKIVPIGGNYIDEKTFTAFDENLTKQQITCQLRKSNKLWTSFGGINATADRVCRLNYDLLIDNEESE